MNGPSAILRARRVDLWLSLFAVSILVPTLSYRYGIDQALYHYVGAGWLEGRVPYRDAFDIKPPGIYALYALSIRILGPGQSSIRIAETACIVAVGWLSAAAVRRDGRPVDGVAGATTVLLASFYSSRFGFWDTAQVELWEGACIVAAYRLLPGGRGRPLRVVAAGSLGSLGILFKVTALVPVLLLGAVLVARAKAGSGPLSARARSAAGSSLAFVAGLAAPLFVTVVYFRAHSALPSLLEWLRYAVHYGREPLDPAWVFGVGPETLVAPAGLWYAVFFILWLLGWSEARERADRLLRRSSLESLLLLSGAVVSVLVQRRYLSYHASVFGPFLVLLSAGGAAEAFSARRALATSAVFALAVGSFLGATPWLGAPAMSYRAYVLHAYVPHLLGKTSDAAFEEVFVGPFDYSYAAHREIAALIRERGPRKGDQLHVRGYDPTTYVLTGLFSPSRFMMDVPLTNRYLSSFDPGWAEEHETALAIHPPRFVVAEVADQRGVALLVGNGYGRVGTRGPLVLLERDFVAKKLSFATLTAALPGRIARGTAAKAVPFELRFSSDGAVTGESGGGSDTGTYSVTAQGSVCVRFSRFLEAKLTCVDLFEGGEHLTAFDAEGREIAELDLIPPLP